MNTTLTPPPISPRANHGVAWYTHHHRHRGTLSFAPHVFGGVPLELLLVRRCDGGLSACWFTQGGALLRWADVGLA